MLHSLNIEVTGFILLLFYIDSHIHRYTAGEDQSQSSLASAPATPRKLQKAKAGTGRMKNDPL